MNEAMPTACLLAQNLGIFLKTIPGRKEGGIANYVAGCAGLWQEGIDTVLSILPLKLQQEDEREIVLSVSIERERLMIEIRSSISCDMQPDKETIQSFSCGLEKSERNEMVFKNSLERMGVW